MNPTAASIYFFAGCYVMMTGDISRLFQDPQMLLGVLAFLLALKTGTKWGKWSGPNFFSYDEGSSK